MTAIARYAIALGKEVRVGEVHVPAGVPDDKLVAYCLHHLEATLIYQYPCGDLNMVIRRAEELPQFEMEKAP